MNRGISLAGVAACIGDVEVVTLPEMGTPCGEGVNLGASLAGVPAFTGDVEVLTLPDGETFAEPGEIRGFSREG